MAVDYSKLSDEELEAIASNDYSKLSDATLRAIANEPTGQQQPTAASQFAAPQALPVAKQFAQNLMGGPATANVRDAASIAKNIGSWTPNSMMEVISSPVQTAKAYVAGHPFANTPVSTLAKDVGKNVLKAGAQSITAPEGLMMLPYTMAGYEMEKIRANPTAPEYATNPYAQTVRGEYPTMGAAGVANRRQALSTMPYGNLSPQEQEIVRQQYAPQEPQQPTAENFIERMKRLAQQYGPLMTR